jgi:uncharacterized protein YigA (DUF484 family)
MDEQIARHAAYTVDVVHIHTERLRKEVDELRAEVANLAHRLNHAIVNLQGQLDDKVNAEGTGAK